MTVERGCARVVQRVPSSSASVREGAVLQSLRAGEISGTTREFGAERDPIPPTEHSTARTHMDRNGPCKSL